MNMLRIALPLVVCALLSWSAPSHAQVRRFALIAGNNHGLSSDITLRHAVSDAERVSSVLNEIGGFAPENVLLLRDASADSFRQALSAMYDRIKVQAPRESSLLFLYYSGHADAQDLHLRDSRFALSELGQLARAAPTSVRLVILDACQSGALTRVKGGRVQQAFALPDEERQTMITTARSRSRKRIATPINLRCAPRAARAAARSTRPITTTYVVPAM
jgi:hypothetical protein